MKVLKLIIVFFSLIVLPVEAQIWGQLADDIPLSFYLGLSIPVIFLAFIRALAKPSLFVYPCLAVIVFFFLMGCIQEHIYIAEPNNHLSWIIFASVFYFSLLHLMPNHSDWFEELTLTAVKSTTLSLIILLLCFFSSVVAFETTDVKLLWLAWFVIATLIAYGRGYLLVRYQHSSYLWLIITLVVTFISGGAFWLWLNQERSQEITLLTLGIGFVIVLLHLTWALLVDQKAKPIPQSIVIDNDDWQQYARDVVTNFPLQGQAVRKLETLLKQGHYQRLAAISFKPINFAQANKILGYDNSDALLLQLAFSLQKQSLNIPGLVNLSFSQIPFYIARLHSLHFLIVFDLSDNRYDEEVVVEQVCHQLTDAIPQAMTFKSYTMNFELAFGVSMFNQGETSVKQTLAFAEDALLQAEQTKQQIFFFDRAMGKIPQEQLVKMEQLKVAVENNSFEYFVQPQVNLVAKEVVGYEVQLTWSSNQKQALVQEQVFEVAEQSGDVFDVFKLLFEQGVKFIESLQARGALSPVSINLSNSALLDEVTVEYIERKITEHNIAADYLMITVSEELLLTSSEQVKLAFDQLRSIGIKIAISQFSGSYESLRYVRRLSIDQVRINCKALAFSEDREPEKAIMNALIHLSSVIGLPLIGVNVDSAAIEAIFRELGGESAQGNIIAPAVAMSDAPDWVGKWQAHQAQTDGKVS